jgi:(1->4)-alpha-D-glucan 1-alpha-D-glucosylmutase
MADEMASALNALAREAARVARQNPRTTDFTRNILSSALREVLACFPVYRTYIDLNDAPTADDRRDLDWALAQARKNEPEIDASVFDFVGALISGDLVAQPRSGFSRHKALRCAMKLQQYSGPVMAKSLEDTAFYRYNRFIALNEVGGQPDRFGISLAAFHNANARRAEHWPDTMLGTSTHDTKRGEDTRARLAVLSEIPEEWARNVEAWSRILRARRGDETSGDAPPERTMNTSSIRCSWALADRAAAGLTWPTVLKTYTERIKVALTKSLREAKTYDDLGQPNAAYESAMLSFADLALDPEHRQLSLNILPFMERVARWAAQHARADRFEAHLAGSADIYQGAELGISAVDPDNRRAVDYGQRAKCLEELGDALQQGLQPTWRLFSAIGRMGASKMAVIAALLTFRRQSRYLQRTAVINLSSLKEKKPMRSARFCAAVAPAPCWWRPLAFLRGVKRWQARRHTSNLPPPLSGRRWRNLLSREEGDRCPKACSNGIAANPGCSIGDTVVGGLGKVGR